MLEPVTVPLLIGVGVVAIVSAALLAPRVSCPVHAPHSSLFAGVVWSNASISTCMLFMIRYHSFYPAHREGAYGYLMNDHDREMFEWVKKFNPYDLYSKSDSKPSLQELKPYYSALIDKYFPAKIDF